MDSTYSITQAGNIAVFAAAISLFFSHPDLSDPTTIQTLLTALVIVVGAAISFYGRYRRGDLTALGFRKY